MVPLRSGAARRDGGTVAVRSVPGDRATIWAVGDGDAGSASRALVDRIAAGGVDRLLYLGDVYQRGSAADFRKNYAPSFGRLAALTAPTPGNHDWPRHTSGYDPYWQRALGVPVMPAWYGFDAAGWRILSLDSETAHDARLAAGALAALAAARARDVPDRVLASRAVQRRHASTATTRTWRPLWDALRGHAAIVIAGHEHSMQRLHPIDGITSFVSGAGGRSHYALHRDDPRLAFGDDRSYGALRLRLRRGAASYAYVSQAGRVLDRGTLRCRRLRDATP